MALKFVTKLTNGRSGSETVTFDNSIKEVSICLQSFKFDYGPDTDQYVDEIYITVSNIQSGANNSVSWDWKANMSAEDSTTVSGDNTSVTFLVIADITAS